jgi:hypothetical protein
MIESRVGLATTICLAVAKSVSLTKCHFLSLLSAAPAESASEFCGVETFNALGVRAVCQEAPRCSH